MNEFIRCPRVEESSNGENDSTNHRLVQACFRTFLADIFLEFEFAVVVYYETYGGRNDLDAED